ncbi:MAG: putative transporter [Chthoniobacteraceae bacterium]|nr:putative transporter [Chthoniobacteraceae bacterium]
MRSKPAALLIFIAYIGFVSLGLPDAVIGIAWPSVRESFHLRQGSLSWLFIAAGIGYFISSFFIGRILFATRIGVLLAGSSLIVAASGFGFSLAPIWILFASCSIFHGLGSGAIDAGLNHYAAHHFSARHMNWLHACYSLGATLGPLMMTAVLAGSGSWRAGYAAVGTAMLVLSLLFFATRNYWESAPTPAEPRSSAQASVLETLANSTVRLQVIIFFIYTGLEVSVGQWGFTLLTESRGVARETAGLWITLYWASIGLGRILFGIVVESIGIDRLLRLSMGAAIAGTLLLAARMPAPFPLIGLSLAGLGLAPVYPCMMTRTPQRLGSNFAAHAIGFQVSAAMIGAAILPSLCGWLADIYGLERIPMVTAFLAMTLFLVHEILLRRPSAALPIGRAL